MDVYSTIWVKFVVLDIRTNIRCPNFIFQLDSIRFSIKTSLVRVGRLSGICKILYGHMAAGKWSDVLRSIGPATIFYTDRFESGENVGFAYYSCVILRQLIQK